MVQNDPKAGPDVPLPVPNPIRRPLLGLLAGGVSSLTLMMPLAGGEALARDFQVTGARSGDNFNVTFRRIPMRNYGIKNLGEGGAPGNRCPMPAFEVVNPRQGELRCVGYILPW